MPERPVRLYGIALSHPVLAARGMLDHKGLPYRYIELLAGAHPLSLIALGFRGATVPAVKLPDGQRVQGSLAIARALETLIPTPSLTRANLRHAPLRRRPSAGPRPSCNRCRDA
jgi:glutathione S-transferase